jgi:hypothetical protein
MPFVAGFLIIFLSNRLCKCAARIWAKILSIAATATAEMETESFICFHHQQNSKLF